MFDEIFPPTIASVEGLSDALELKADLIGGKIPNSQLPSVAIVEFLGAVANQSAMLALTGQPGDWCLRTDNGLRYMLIGDDPSDVNDWLSLSAADAVSSVNGHQGIVVLSKSDLGLGNVDNLQQLPLSYLDLDGTLAANSDTRVPSQKAVKTYADTKVPKSLAAAIGDMLYASSIGVWTALTAPANSNGLELTLRGSPSVPAWDWNRSIARSTFAGVLESGAWFDQTLGATNNNTYTFGANRMDMCPFSVPFPVTIAHIAVVVTTNSAGTCKIVIYDSNTNGSPKDPVWTGGDLDCSTTGLKSSALTHSFEPGKKYWLGLRMSAGTIVIRGVAQGNLPTLGPADNASGTQTSGIRRTVTYANVAPTWTWDPAERVGSSMPAFRMEVA